MMPETDRRGAALLARLDATPTPLALLDRVAAARPAHPALEYLPDAAGTPAVVAERLGRGSVIMMADNPVFRATFPGSERLLMNAIFFSGMIDGARGVYEEE